MRVLIAEDDERLAGYLVRGLKESGHVVDLVHDGGTFLAMALEGIYDILVLDRWLQCKDGLDVVKRLRAADPATPLMMTSAAAGAADSAAGLRAGCDDYLSKPIAFAEFLARIEAQRRRADRSRTEATIQVEDLTIDTVGRRVTRAGTSIALQPREYQLLLMLARHAGQVVTRTMLIEAAWDYAFEPRGNIVDMHMHRIRQKIDRGHARPLIHTVHQAGYIMGGHDPAGV